MKPNVLDKAIGYLSPMAGVRRLKARAALEFARSYEAATRGRRTSNWSANGSSANAAMMGSLPLLRARSRDLVRNNPYAKRGIQVIANNVVGSGILAQPSADDPRGGEQALALWDSWVEECDAEGAQNFYGIQNLAMFTTGESGSVLLRRRWRRVSDGLTVPMQIQVLEPDFLDTSKDQVFSDGRRIIGGIEFSKIGRPIAYHLFAEHPGNAVVGASAFRSTRVPAEDIAHCFRVDRPGQVDGVPWLASVIIRMRDLDEVEDAYLIRQKIAACYVAFYHDMEALETIDAEKRLNMEKVEPGMIERLPAGTEVTFGSPPSVDGYADHVRSVLRSIAAGLGITYESLTNDYGNVSFSSGRMGWIEQSRNVDQWQWNLMIPMVCQPVWDWFVEAAIVAGKLKAPVGVTWTPPRREMLDPVKETDAIKTQIRGGFKSLSEVIRESGRDPMHTFREIASDNKKLDELGLVLDTDPRKRTNIGYDPNSGAGRASEE